MDYASGETPWTSGFCDGFASMVPTPTSIAEASEKNAYVFPSYITRLKHANITKE